MTRFTASWPTSGRSRPSVADCATGALAVIAWLTGALAAAPAACAQQVGSPAGRTAAVEAEFRGCESAGWCRFRIEMPDSSLQMLRRVRPDGVVNAQGDGSFALAVRDRLNAVLASMIHQHKRIRLYDMRELDDGTFAATVTVNEADVASDPALVELQRNPAGTMRQ